MIKILVFGVFDGIHEGHRAFLRQTRMHADDAPHQNLSTRAKLGTGHSKFGAGQAQIHADNVWLVAVVARDETTEILKGRRPLKDLGLRIKEIRDSGLVDEAVVEDEKLGTWEVIGKYKPDIIALGYDQDRLRSALLEHVRKHDLDVRVVVMEAHRPEEMHSSLLNSKIKSQNAK